MPTQTQELTVTGCDGLTSDSDVIIQPSGFIAERKKRKRALSHRQSVGRKETEDERPAKKVKGMFIVLHAH